MSTAVSHQAIQGEKVDQVRITRALISVSDKTGVVDLAKALASHNVEILSTGGTATALRNAGLTVVEVDNFTGFPEILNGRVKTLHPLIHGALLGVRGNSQHESEMKTHNIRPIDVVVVNLYPFTETVKSGAGFDQCVENIDIGGPSMIRSSAKNHRYISILTDPSQYASFISELESTKGSSTYATRQKLAAAAFAKTSVYDTAIAEYFAKQTSQ